MQRETEALVTRDVVEREEPIVQCPPDQTEGFISIAEEGTDATRMVESPGIGGLQRQRDAGLSQGLVAAAQCCVQQSQPDAGAEVLELRYLRFDDAGALGPCGPSFRGPAGRDVHPAKVKPGGLGQGGRREATAFHGNGLLELPKTPIAKGRTPAARWIGHG